MTFTTFRRLDSVQVRCPLGVRFRDTATGQVIGSGLRVTAFPLRAGRPDDLRRAAQANRSGVWAFHDLSGFRAYELGGDEPLEFGSAPMRPQFRVEVWDEEERFLPFSFTAEAPTQGLFQLAAPLSPLTALWTDVPLFSAPERPVPAGCAVIRTDLVTLDEARPASWALLLASTTIRSLAVQVLGMTNQQGSAALVFPWPELTGLVFGSPPGGTRLEGQGWEFQIAAWHDFQNVPGELADLDALLVRLGRVPDKLWTELSPPIPFSRAVLTFGRELVVPDENARADHQRQLIITPAE